MNSIVIPNQIVPTKLFSDAGVSSAYLFGSRARGDAHMNSDYDIVFSYPEGSHRSIFDIVRLQSKLETALNASVDLVERSALSPYIREQVLSTLIPIYDRKN